MTHENRIMRAVPLLLLLVFASTFCWAQQEAKQNVIAMVIRINGSLQYRESDSADWQGAKVLQPLMNGYQLRTEIGNRAVIVYNSGTRILVNENTQLEVTAQQPGTASPERTKLLVGEVFSKIPTQKRDNYEYEVETPSSVASVRGTQFNSNYKGGVATFVSIENIVTVMNQLGSVILQQYHMTTVPTGQQPTDPEDVGQGGAEDMTNWTETVEPTWKLNIVPQGGANQLIGTPFNITIYTVDPATNAVVDATFDLTSFYAEPALDFSTDGGKTWIGSPEIILVNGLANIMARGNAEGMATITAEADDSEPSSIQIQFAQEKVHKDVTLSFTKPDGSGEQTLILKLEEK